jgi:hypothetical protein
MFTHGQMRGAAYQPRAGPQPQYEYMRAHA